MDNVDETLHATLEANLDQGVDKRLKPEESEVSCRVGNSLEGSNLESSHQEEQSDLFHQEEMSEGSEVVFNIIPSHDKDDDDNDDHDDDVDDDDDYGEDDDDDDGDDDQVGEGEGSVVSSVTDKYGFLAGDVLLLEVGHHHQHHHHG